MAMITVKQLLDAEIGAKTGGFALTIKTVKKRWQVKDKWIHQVVLNDTTGDILTDVVKDSNAPFFRNNDLYIVVCEIQASENGKKLVVHEWKQETFSEPPEPNWNVNEADRVVRSKIKCWLVASGIQAGQVDIGESGDINKNKTIKIVDFIME